MEDITFEFPQDIYFVNESEEEQHKVYRFDKSKDIYDIISYFLGKKSSNDNFYIVDIDKIHQQYLLWNSELSFIKPYYAIKSNPDHIIMKLLSSLGCGFDCASKTEINEAINYVKPFDVIYANPCKEITHLQFARSHDVDLLTFDSEAELHKIKLHHPEAKLIIRIKVDDSSSKCKFSSKFGCDLEEADELLNLIKVLKLNLVGVSFHVGSNCTSSGFFDKAITDAKKVFDMARDKYGMTLNLLDIGGGFPGFNEKTEIQFSDIAKEIRDSIDNNFKDQKDEVQFMAEPGRFFCTTSHTLIFNIIGMKKKKNGDNIQYQYTINDGIYGSFSAVVFDYAQPIIKPFNERDEDKLYPSTIFGPTCDSLDKISDSTMLPKLTIGDWCFVENFGAYTRASSTNFNGFQSAEVYYISKDN